MVRFHDKYPPILLSILVLIICFGSNGGPIAGTEHWKQATAPRVWTFPRDHGSHPGYRTEWWYFTGNLVDQFMARYGYQLTFFRQGVQLRATTPNNPWSLRDLYLAHFATTSVAMGHFASAERTSRAGPSLAGARTERMDVWIFDWSAKMEGPIMFLEARNTDMELQLKLTPRKPLVLHGPNGLSRKGSEQGQASYYYSFTDLETRGLLRTSRDSSRIPVTGTSWFDHEFGSNVLASNQAGWDWFSLHLSDRRDLMIYFLRRTDGSVESASSGTVVEATGTSRHLTLNDIHIEVLDQWPSPRSGGIYPSRWHIRVASAMIDLIVSPLVADQELFTEGSTNIIYWEGAVAGKGTSMGQSVTCQGYAELTGYAGSLGGVF